VYFDPLPYLRSLEYRIRQLEEKWKRLEEETRRLQHQLQQLKPVHIEHIHYKIQELHLRDLSGTLNIGLTALSDPEQLEQWLKRQPAPGEVELDMKPAAENRIEIGDPAAASDLAAEHDEEGPEST